MFAQNRTIRVILACLLVAMVSAEVRSQNIQIVGGGFAEDFGSNFGGSDSFPFTGLQTNDLISFHYEIDSQVMQTSVINGIARYDFTSAGSFYMIGSNMMTLDSFSLFVGTSTLGSETGVLSITGRNEAFGVTAAFQLQSTSALSTEIPTQIDLSLFNAFRMLSVNSDQNNVLFPNVLGPVTNISVVPAPGAGLALLGGLTGMTVGGRRRR